MDRERYEKLELIRSYGVHPYPAKYINTISTKEFENTAEGETVKLSGRMMLFRSMGKLSFGHIQDLHGRTQFCFQEGTTEVFGLDTEKISSRKFWEKMLDLGDYIGIEGEVFITKHGEKTVLVKTLSFLGKSLRSLPEKFSGVHNEETKLRQRYLETLSSKDARDRFLLRSQMIRSIREFFWKNEFIEVETPILEHSATGASALPYFTKNNALDLDLVLRISHELPLKKIITGGFEKIFEIGKAFRNEGIDPSHLPEHTHFEWYSAYWSFEENMEYSEKLIQHIFSSLNISPLVPIKNKEGKETIIDFGKPFERIDYIQRILQDTGIDILKYTEDEKGLLLEIEKQGVVIEDAKNMGYASLVDNLYKQTTRKKITGPAFLYNYPLKMQPLARVSDTNPNIVDQFQLVVNGWEIMKAYSELVDPVDQAKRFWQQEQEALKGDAEAMQGDNEYITCMEYGMPPISGAGFGIDRFITLITQQDNLRDCVFFPLMRPKP